MKREPVGSEKIVRTTSRTFVRNILVFVIVLYVIATFADRAAQFPYINLEKTQAVATITRIDGSTETYDQNYFPLVYEGETLTYEIAPLQHTGGIQNGTLVFSLYHCYVSVYCGDRLIYRQTAPDRGAFIGHRYYVVPLPSGYEKEQIRIEAVCSEHDTFNTIANLKIVPADCTTYAFRYGHFATGIILMILLFCSIFMELSSLLLRLFNRQQDGMFSISFLCSSICLWYMGYSGYLQPFLKGAEALAMAEYIGLYLAAIAIPFFIQCHTSHRKLRIFCTVLSIFQTGFFVFASAMTFFVYGVSYVDYIVPLRLMLLFVLTVLLVVEIWESRKTAAELSERILHYGMVVTIGFAVLELVRFLLAEQISDSFPWIIHSLTPLAIYALVVTSLLYNGARNTENQYEMIEKENLARLAFIDQLTGAPNRAALNRWIDQMKDQHITDFVVAFIDINFLKRTNDTWGHEKGDELIRTASDLLKKHFTGEDFFGRWGGDEFIAVHFGSLQEAEKIEAAIEKETAVLNASGAHDFMLSAAWGFGVSTKEAPMPPEEAIREADRQMYTAKQKAHVAR